MKEKINEQDEIISEELLNRMREVSKILGVEVPDDIEIKEGRISLSGYKNLKPSSHIHIYHNHISFLLESNDFRYVWSASFLNDGGYQEKFNNNSFDTVFFQTKEASITSGFYLYDHIWGSPKIYCNLENVIIYRGEKNQEPYPVDNYYFVVEDYLRGNNPCYKMDYPVSSKEIDIILEIFGSLIKNHVQDLITNDQSWRFTNEKNKIMSEYYKKRVEAMQRCFKNAKKTFVQLKEYLKYRYTDNGIIEKLEKLDKMEDRYNHGDRVDMPSNEMVIKK